jgi:cyclic dehypoxanthinyl futalosine synthase
MKSYYNNTVNITDGNFNRMISASLPLPFMNMQLTDLYQKAARFEFLTKQEGVFLFEKAPLTELMFLADELRKKQVPHGKVTWQIDRNVNTTNVCIANCKFCNFYRIPGHAEAYITDMPTYRKKIEETLRWGGDQLLLQGGHHPELGLDFYVNTFSQIKKEFPTIKLHTLGPPEVAHITKLEKSNHRDILIGNGFITRCRCRNFN